MIDFVLNHIKVRKEIKGGKQQTQSIIFRYNRLKWAEKNCFQMAYKYCIYMYFLHASKRISELSLTNNYKTLIGFIIVSTLSLVELNGCKKDTGKNRPKCTCHWWLPDRFLSQAVYSHLQKQAKKFSLIHQQQNVLKEPWHIHKILILFY